MAMQALQKHLFAKCCIRKTLLLGKPFLPNQVTACRSLNHIPLEPDYLDSKEPQIPLYDALNLQIKSYDFTVLESFSSYIHKTAENMEIEVEDCWAAPCKKYNIHTYKPSSTLLDNQYNLNIYERNVQVVDLKTTVAPLFFSVIQTALPEGVQLMIKPHEPEDEELRYVPDFELRQLKAELDSLGGPSEQSKRKK